MATASDLSLTAILVRDNDSGGYTAFFAQCPNIIAEGNDEESAAQNLFVLASDVFRHQEKEAVESIPSNLEVKTRAFALLV